MTLINSIKEEMFNAKKAKQPVRASLLNTLWAEATRVGKDAGNRETTDIEVLAVIKKFLKGVDEVINRSPSDRALAIAIEEQEILLSYLPKQLTRDELKTIIVGFNTKDKGTIMRLLKEQYAGQYDGKLASIVVGEL